VEFRGASHSRISSALRIAGSAFANLRVAPTTERYLHYADGKATLAELRGERNGAQNGAPTSGLPNVIPLRRAA
jgi:hypothetical protein